ncbi:hypothetical protein BHM03_00020065, partial [Ensete ventricosum]
PCSVMSYKMQVLRNPKVKARPLFRVTTDDGEQELPNSRVCSKYFESYGDMPMGYRAVRVDWKDLDRCGVCDMDEEYEDNLFLQCDKCRIMVIEYIGELVRPTIADIRERRIYNSLVVNLSSIVVNID